MDKVLAYSKQLYKNEKIQQFKLELDSEKNVKCEFVVFTLKDKKYFEWRVSISNYRFLILTRANLTKEDQEEYEKHFGNMIQRNVDSRSAVYVQNKWNSQVDVDYVREIIEYLIDPETNIQRTRSQRNISSSHF